MLHAQSLHFTDADLAADRFMRLPFDLDIRGREEEDTAAALRRRQTVSASQ